MILELAFLSTGFILKLGKEESCGEEDTGRFGGGVDGRRVL